MKRKSIYTLAAVALALAGLSSCSEKETTVSGQFAEGEYPVTFTAASITGTQTRATVDSDWDGVSSVAVQVGDVVKEYSVTTDTDAGVATLSSSDPFYWQSTDDITVTAWCPYSTSFPEITVAGDQSTQEKYQDCDIIAVKNATVTYSAPTLQFSHQTAKIAVTLKAGGGISNTELDAATVSIVNLDGVTGANSGEGSVDTYKNIVTTIAEDQTTSSDTTYLALVAPQDITAGTKLIKVTIDSNDYNYTPDNGATFTAGYQYAYTITVNKTGLEVITVNILDWDDAFDTDETGEASFQSYVVDSKGNYTVFSAAGLLAWAAYVNSGNYGTGCTLAADIDMTDVTWTPVCGYQNYPNQYTGTFDGAGHTISNLTASGTEPYEGFICSIGSTGVVRDLTLEKFYIYHNSSGPVFGGIAGGNEGTIMGCAVSGSVGKGAYNGGIVGYNAGGTITACYFMGSVSGNIDTGGIAGNNSNSGTITACYITGSVSCAMDDRVGGIVGRNFGPISSCYWSADGVSSGIGTDYNSGEATQVDGTTVMWYTTAEDVESAMDKMNSALEDAGYAYRYVANEDPDTSDDEPLLLTKVTE